MEPKHISHMNGGDGGTSYANNSGLQKVAISKTWAVLDEALKEMFTENGFPKCMKMADLGCSSGPNTLVLVSDIVDTIEDLCKNDNLENLPQLEVFLNDLPGNDFNTLFKLMSSFGPNNGKERKLECFMYGVPGSFYDKLFPSNSIHFAYSFYSVHWLSQIPEGLGKANKENICMTWTCPPQVFDAYTKQFRIDFSRFLSSRAEEITSGGRMVLAFAGRSKPPSNSDNEYFHFALLAQVLSDMVDQGLVKKDDLYSFNIPMHAPCPEEIEEIIRDEGSFNLAKMEVVMVPWGANNNDNKAFDKYKSAKFIADIVRAMMEPQLASHFGSSIVDGVFVSYVNKAAEYLSKYKESLYVFTPVISLTRKPKGM
ncbi:benzoate carboxyl methyltransferase [Phtheirospermum japonicum]|uniref:Benzoate carboxyl methyltransferase n=1 Tax=Phtheirospermum japonicum TaxID=374723 RepID=A0A830BXJ3_9LAMI|nr:benzoate carboxyl methyltransferase [Phtheirospermum japonicum]